MIIHYIYALVDPDTNLTRYIGATRYKEQRKHNHKKEKSNPEKREWYERLFLEGKEPIFVILEECSEEEWLECEAKHIREAREKGYELLNRSPGGKSKAKILSGMNWTKIRFNDDDFKFIQEYTEATGVSMQYLVTKAVKELIINTKAQQTIDDSNISFTYVEDDEI